MSSLKKTKWIIISVLAVILGVIGIFYFHNPFPNVVGVSANEIVIGTEVIAYLATAIALIVLVLDLINDRRSRYLDGAIRLFELLATKETRKDREMIYSAFQEKRPFTSKELESAEQIRADLDQVGVMVKEGLLPKEIALGMFSGMTIQCWRALQEQIKTERELRALNISRQNSNGFILKVRNTEIRNFQMRI